jgi:haloalkane dehalogenase
MKKQIERFIPIILLLLMFSNTVIAQNKSINTKKMYNNNTTIEDHRKNQNSFSSSDGVIKYIDQGKGEVILLLHGVPTSSWLYRKMIDDLVIKGYRVIAPDMLGFGNSDSPNGYEIYSSKEHSKRLIELMDSLEISSWNHLMHDAGGAWTWELIKNNPNRVSKLIVLNTLILEEGFFPPVKMKKGWFAKFILSLYRSKITSRIMLKMLFKNGLTDHKLSKTEIKGYQKSLLEGKTKGMYYFFTQLSKPFPNYEKTLKQLDIPVAIIWGKHDKILKWEPQKERVSELLKIESHNIHIIDGNHFIQEEQPNKITAIINDFIKKTKD